jgi:aminoglycoside phosphotransferase family enzyme/predicted kinase
VVAITRSADGTLAIDGGGEPVEWAVEMIRFDESQTVDQLAAAAELAPDLVLAIADVIAASHRAATIAATDPWLQSIPVIIDGNSRAFRADPRFAADAILRLDRQSRDSLARISAALQARGARGMVRHCHGDLHLANIVVLAGQPVLFDAIEFDPKIASIDVVYDLAFALMDLLHYGRRDAANLLFNRYFAVTAADNADALVALPLLMSLRAAIRGQVMLSRPGRDADQAAANHAIAESYFDLALRLIAPEPARLIAIGGLSGTGKSALARALAGRIDPAPGALWLRSDVIRKQFYQVAETARLPAEAYAVEVTARVYQTLAERAAQALRQGHSVIVDAVFARQAERLAIAGVAADLKLRCEGLYLQADLDTRIVRITGRTNDASDATAEIARQQQHYAAEPNDWTAIDASGSQAETLVRSEAALASAIAAPA